MFLRLPSRMEDLALFTRHLAGAMQSRTPLPDILNAYAQEAENNRLARASVAMAGRIAVGEELADSMDAYPSLFPPAYRRLVRLGEQGHSLSGVMDRLAESIEESLKNFEYYRRAAIYPLLVLLLLLADISFVLVMITPKFQAIFSELGGMHIPGPLGDPAGLANLLMIIFGALLCVPILFLLGAVFNLRVRALGAGRFILQLPWVGPVLRRAETARFAQFLGLLLEQRIPMAEALDLLANSAENTYIRAALADFAHRYAGGERLSDLVARQPVFPPTMATMINSAEDQGRLGETLRDLGRFYAERTRHGLSTLREVFEPMMLLLIGLLVALILVSFYSPLFYIPGLIK
jgi:type II secretory pathway component PulF